MDLTLAVLKPTVKLPNFNSIPTFQLYDAIYINNIYIYYVFVFKTYFLLSFELWLLKFGTTNKK